MIILVLFILLFYVCTHIYVHIDKYLFFKHCCVFGLNNLGVISLIERFLCIFHVFESLNDYSIYLTVFIHFFVFPHKFMYKSIGIQMYIWILKKVVLNVYHTKHGAREA